MAPDGETATLPTAPLRFLALLVLASVAGPVVPAVSAATPFPMASGGYFESFDDIANWTNNFASGIGAQYGSSVPGAVVPAPVMSRPSGSLAPLVAPQVPDGTRVPRMVPKWTPPVASWIIPSRSARVRRGRGRR